MRHGTLAVALALAGLVAVAADAAPPTHHGKLKIGSPGRGRIDLNTGNATFWVHGWTLVPSSDSNGIDPATEGVIIAVGDSENFVLPADQLKASKSGTRFTYRAKSGRGIRMLKLVKNADGSFTVRFKVAGADFSRLLLLNRPAVDCLPFALIIGDDDGFSGVNFELPKLSPLSGLLTIPGFCDNVPGWPWT
jgi:hypothetical protein